MKKTSSTNSDKVQPKGRRRIKKRTAQSIPDQNQRSIKDFFGKEKDIVKKEPKTAKRKMEFEEKETGKELGTLGTLKKKKIG